MNNFTISIFENKILFEIINELKLFSEYKINFHEDLGSCIKPSKEKNKLIVLNLKDLKKIKDNDLPLIVFSASSKFDVSFHGNFVEYLAAPFQILDFHKKTVSLFSKLKFRDNSLIYLNNYIIDKNERKIKKNNIEMKLSEKEVNLLILFSNIKEPINKNSVLKEVWNYSAYSETHTVETHIHRLRKKILNKFNDNNLIKNNNKGYFV